MNATDILNRTKAPDYPVVGRCKARQLERRLVEDAVARQLTPLQWFIAAIARIATLRRKSQEQVIVDIDAEVRARCGRGLPVY